MRMYDLIMKKKNGGEMTAGELKWLVDGYVAGEIPDYQMSAFLMAVWFRGMTPRETTDLTLCMAHSGDMTDLSSIPGIKADKHSTGGVGDKTTLVTAPEAAACGLKIAKMSGRGLGFTGGTVDKLESIPGLHTAFDHEEFMDIVKKTGIAVVGQSGNLTPADKKMYALRDVTATIDSLPLIASSIMSKKLAAGSDVIVLDVKCGSGAFMKKPEDARALAEQMVDIGCRAGRKMAALITDMDRPLGHAVGNSLEVIEAVCTLQGTGPEDLAELSRELAANMLSTAGMGCIDVCRERVDESVRSGKAFEKLTDLAAAQGGDPQVLRDPSRFEKAPVCCEIKAKQSGYICSMDTEAVGMASCMLGAGRETKESPIDHSAGIILKKKTGDKVAAGDVLAIFYTSKDELLPAAEKRFEESIRFSQEKPLEKPLIYGRVTAEGYEKY
ncbi:MAG: pyrimidine-nucleoside phosphorylase [Lachnospiraceae bacterium]